jgi:hypothetical protein
VAEAVPKNTGSAYYNISLTRPIAPGFFEKDDGLAPMFSVQGGRLFKAL